MKKFTLNFNAAVLLIAAILFSACSKPADQYMNSLPKDAGIVLTYDLKSIATKGEFNKIPDSKMFAMLQKEMKKEDPKVAETVQELIKNPLVTGIDLTKDVFVFLPNDFGYVGVLAKLGKEGEWDKYLENLNKKAEGSIKVNKEEKLSTIAQENVVVAWDGAKIMVLAGIHMQDPMPKMKELMAQKAEASLNENADFAEFMKGKKDVSYWIDLAVVEGLFKNLKELSHNPMMSQQMDIPFDKFPPMAGSYMHLYADYAKGEIVGASKFNPSKEYLEKINPQEIYKDGISDAMLNMIPKDKALAIFAAAMNFNKMTDYFKGFIPEDAMAQMKMGLQQVGLTEDNVFNFFDGEILFTFNGLKTVPVTRPQFDFETNTEKTVTVDQPIPMFTLNFTVNDDALYKKAVEMLIPMAGQMGVKIEKKGSFYAVDLEGVNVYIGMKDKVFLVTNCDAVFEGAEKGFGDASLAATEHGKMMKSNPSYMYINLNFASYPDAIKNAIYSIEEGAKPMIDKVMGILDPLENITTVSRKDGTGTMKISFKNKDENALVTIFKMVDEFVVFAEAMHH